MRLVDVDVLVCGHRLDAPHHQADAAWFGDLLAGQEPYGIAGLVLGGFLRIVATPKVFSQPTPVETALDFAGLVRSQPTCVPVEPGQRHWGIFTGLGRSAGVTGNRVPDADLAALAIESGGEWITTDHDFSRFPGLRGRHPLQEQPAGRLASPSGSGGCALSGPSAVLPPWDVNECPSQRREPMTEPPANPTPRPGLGRPPAGRPRGPSNVST